jgi:hypothetical protein
MSTITAEHIPEEEIREEKKTAEVIFGGSVVEGFVAAGAAVLAIIALTGGFPELLLSISIIALGVALMFEGAAISLRLYNLLSETARNRFSMAELGLGTTAETIAGVFSAALGVLAILQIHPMFLIPAAIVVVGASLVLGAGTNAKINAIKIRKVEEHPFAQEITRQIVWAATEIQVLSGVGAITLGILALSGVAPVVLSLVAILAMAASILLSGTAISSRMLAVFGY